MIATLPEAASWEPVTVFEVPGSPVSKTLIGEKEESREAYMLLVGAAGVVIGIVVNYLFCNRFNFSRNDVVDWEERGGGDITVIKGGVRGIDRKDAALATEEASEAIDCKSYNCMSSFRTRLDGFEFRGRYAK